ncbi:hypothetical protein DC498_24110 [Terrimonas sp.]|uniref:vitamin K epoxide reductase family protein n=1 Tax=Terrimonas sp. TaxID=1914338 RepID=UPI000D5130FD|nr:vitamin K epoxide reductase family protein [Terrimonas sp.]PVD49620.1 hypothetical protein DC498_24110 [Terrimonas sp.]
MRSYLENLLLGTTNGTKVLYLFTQEIKLKVSRSTLIAENESHPYYPSILSISDVLKKHGVENLSMELRPEKLINVPVPFITSVKGKSSIMPHFSIVKSIDKAFVTASHPENNKWETLPLEQFMSRYTGTVLIFDTESPRHAEIDYEKNSKIEKKKLIVFTMGWGSVTFLILINYIFAFLRVSFAATLPIIFTSLAILGCVVCTLLAWYELDQDNLTIKQICSSGKKINCNALINSKASKIWGISWSTIGFSYFMMQLLILLLYGIINEQILFIVAWFNILTIPYIPFSLYYQWKVAKQWCVLCVSVQILLGVQFFVTLFAGWLFLKPYMDIQTMFGVSMVTITVFILANMVKTILVKAKENKLKVAQLRRLKHDSDIFEAVLKKQKVVTAPDKNIGISLGNPIAKYGIIKVCNPYCAPCAKAHPVLESLLHQHTNIKLQIIFTATNDDSDLRSLPVKHFLAIAQSKDELLIENALDDWYLATEKNYEAFAIKFPLDSELGKQTENIERMNDWCNSIDVQSTPTFYISLQAQENENQFYQLPDLYTINDLTYFFTEID